MQLNLWVTSSVQLSFIALRPRGSRSCAASTVVIWLIALLVGLSATTSKALDEVVPLVPTPASLVNAPSELSWERIADDLELAQISVPVNALLSSEILLLRTSLSRYQLSVRTAAEFGWKRNTVEAIVRASNAVVGINANFFDETGRPLGLVISRGILVQPLHRGGGTLSGVFNLGNGAPRIVNRSGFSPRGVTEAIQSGPRLLSGGEPVKGLRDDTTLSRRAGLCVDERGRLILFAVSSGFLGVSFQQLRPLLQRAEIGCVDALNLDGGGSAQLFMSNSLPGAAPALAEVSIQGTDPVPVVLTLSTR